MPPSQDTDARDPRGANAFPSTHWSLLLAGPQRDRGDALEVLARRYFRPIEGYVRARWARNDEEAREAAQEFFVWMMETGFLGRADPARGRFRGFVKRSLANFLHDRERSRRTARRGGARAHVALDADPSFDPPDTSGRSPEALLDDLWREELLAQAADALEAELRGKGKDVVFEVFRDYFLREEELDYETVAARYSITTVDVSNHLMLAKKRYRAHLRNAVLETVQGDDDLRAELAWLFEGGRP